MLRRVLGLDVGSHAVKAVELRQTLRSVEVVQMRTLPLDVPGPALGEELRDFVTAHGLPTDHVVCALPGDRVSSRRLSFPFRDRRRIEQAVPFAVEGEVPFDLDEFFLDWELVGGDRSRADVVATLAPRSEVALLLKTLAEAAIEPRVVEAEGLSLANLGALFELPGPRLLVDLGHRKTTLCLVLDGRPAATRTIAIAGQALTQAIAKERHLAEGEAERQKLESGVFAHGLDAGGSEVHALLDRLARELVRTVGSLETILAKRGARIDEVTLLGGTSRLHRLPDYLAQRTGLAVAVLPPPPEPWRAPVLAAGDPLLFAPALALALRGTTRARTRMNFRQDEFARRVNFRRLGRELRWTGILAAAACVLALASAAVQIGREGRRAARVEDRIAALYQEAFPGEPAPPDAVAALREAARSARGRADLLGVYGGSYSALDLLAEVSARVPRDLAVVFDEFNVDRQTVRIRGYTESFENVDRLRAELARFEPFAQIGVSEVQSDSRRGDGTGKTFNLTIQLGDAKEAP
jgi:general secretion pathway protein L